MSDCAGCILRFVKKAFMKYTLRIPLSHITYHWNPNYKRSCHELLITAKVQDTSFYSDLL